MTNHSKLSCEHLGVVMDGEVIVAPPDDNIYANNMVIGPDGAIWINSTTTDPGLFKSTDRGRSWTSVPIGLARTHNEHHLAGFTVTRDGRLWAVHQDVPDTTRLKFDGHVSVSDDQGQRWSTYTIDYPSFAPGAPDDPYKSIDVSECHPNFIERRDGTVMFSASMRYGDWEDYQQADQSRPGIRDVMIRTRDGGKTWGDPTIVHQHATETDYAVDPHDADHILATTRIQRHALPGEDPKDIKKAISGVPYPPQIPWCYKNGLLLESTDGGRRFREVPGGLLGFGSYRWCAVWTQENVVVLLSGAGQEVGEKTYDDRKVARISLNGGKTWVDGSASGTPALNKATKFTIVAGRDNQPSHCVASTVHLGNHHFLTMQRYKVGDTRLTGTFWHLA